MEILAESRRAVSGIGYTRTINRLQNKASQQEFWGKHLKTVLALFDISQEVEAIQVGASA